MINRLDQKLGAGPSALLAVAQYLPVNRDALNIFVDKSFFFRRRLGWFR
jgi:hypothetical protein